MGRKRKEAMPAIAAGNERGGIALDRALVEGFVRNFLLKRFDSPKTTPRFHKELWDLCCAPERYVAIAAPRGHAKSTACTLSFTLAAMLFGFRDFALIISASEALAILQLQEIRVELTENEDLIDVFQIHGLSKDNEAELVCHVGDRVFKIMARGAEQKLRGIKWRNRRPNLVMIDDLEEDEAVLNPDRRRKLAHWVNNALLPAGSDDCLFRMVGTILHEASFLNRALANPVWLSRVYRAHRAYDDFSEILWPEKFPESRLRTIRQIAIEEENPSGYSQEYLNVAIAETDRYFRPEWFVDMELEDRRTPKRFYSAVDFAIGKENRNDRTAIVTLGAMPDGRIAIVDCRAGRWDSFEIMEQMFAVHEDFEPEIFLCEEGAIRKTIGPFLNAEMVKRNTFLNLELRVPVKDKEARAKSFQGRMRAGGVVVDKDAEWYAEWYEEMVSFPRGRHDDRVDATAWLGQILDSVQPADTDAETEEAEMAYEELMSNITNGRCTTTGY